MRRYTYNLISIILKVIIVKDKRHLNLNIQQNYRVKFIVQTEWTIFFKLRQN